MAVYFGAILAGAAERAAERASAGDAERLGVAPGRRLHDRGGRPHEPGRILPRGRRARPVGAARPRADPAAGRVRAAAAARPRRRVGAGRGRRANRAIVRAVAAHRRGARPARRPASSCEARPSACSPRRPGSSEGALDEADPPTEVAAASPGSSGVSSTSSPRGAGRSSSSSPSPDVEPAELDTAVADLRAPRLEEPDPMLVGAGFIADGEVVRGRDVPFAWWLGPLEADPVLGSTDEPTRLDLTTRGYTEYLRDFRALEWYRIPATRRGRRTSRGRTSTTSARATTSSRSRCPVHAGGRAPATRSAWSGSWGPTSPCAASSARCSPRLPRRQSPGARER